MVAIRVRDVPPEVREILISEAERRDQSLQFYLMGVLEREARSAKNLEWLRAWKPVGLHPGASSAEVVEEGRRERDRGLAEALGYPDLPDDE